MRGKLAMALAVVAGCGGATARDDRAAPNDAGTYDGDAASASCTLLPELAASPRSDADAELLAIEVSGGIGAPSQLYDLISRDLAAIRATSSDIASIHTRARWPRGITLRLDADAFAQASQGTFHGWDCLNAKLGVVKTGLNPRSSWAALDVGDRRLDTRLASAAYDAIPGLHDLHSAITGDGSTICAAKGADDTMAYVFYLGGGDCPAGCTERTYWGFRVSSEGAVTFVGKVASPFSGLPAWLVDLGTPCTKR